METLRIILIVVGVLLIAGIYLAEPLKAYLAKRRSRHPSGPAERPLDSDEVLGLKSARDDEPADEWVGESYVIQQEHPVELDGLQGLGAEQVRLDDDLHLAAVAHEEPQTSVTADGQDGLVVVLTIMAGEGKTLRGPLLLKALQDAGLEHGAMDIFHYTPEGASQALFSVANILEPGHFVLSEMVQMETPGVALFMQLPTHMAGELAWLHLRNRAEQLAEALHATLCDAERCPLDEEGLLLLQHQAEGFQAV